MIRILVSFIFLVISDCIIGQTNDTITGPPINTSYSDTTRFDLGMVKTVNYYSNDSQLVRSVQFYENENVAEVKNYEGGIPHGWTQSWYDDGLSKSYLIYWHGFLSGGTSWYPTAHIESFITTGGGITTATSYYENDSISTIVKSKQWILISEEKRCKNGQVEYITYFDSCYQQKEYYCSGALKLSCKKSKQTIYVGPYMEWHENGRIAVRGNYLEQEGIYPIKDGVWSYFDSEGRTIKKEKYDKGKLIWTK